MTTLKTISMYLRSAKTEAEAAGESTEGMVTSVSKLREEILGLTGNKVDIQIDENTFKSTYQILKELSKVWGDLTDITKANILEKIGGKRNSNVVAALLENFSVAENALETSANSAGSALSENEKVLESIQGKLNILKASFESLSSTIINSDFIKSSIDGAATILDLITSIADLIGTFPLLLSAVSSVMTAKSIAKGNTGGLFSFIKGADDTKGHFQTSLFGVEIHDLIDNFKKAKNAGLGFGGALRSSVLPALNQNITAIDQYNSLSSKSVAFQEKYNKTLAESDDPMSKYLRSLNGGTASLKGYNDYCKSAGIQTKALGSESKLAAIGINILNYAVNMLASAGLGLLIQQLIYGLDELINASSKASERANALAEETKEKAEANLEEIRTLDELISKYTELKENEYVDANTRDEIRTIQDEIVSLVGAEAGGLDLVNGKLDNNLKKLREIQKLQAQETLDSAKANYNAAIDAENKAVASKKGSFSNPRFGNFAYIGSINEDVEQILKDAGYQLNVVRGGWFGLTMTISDNITALGTEATGAVEKAEVLKGMIEALKEAGVTDSEIFTSLQQQYQEYEDYISKTTDAANNLLEATYQAEKYSESLQAMTVNSVESYEAYKAALIEAIKDSDMLSAAMTNNDITDDNISLFVDDIMAANFPELYNQIAESSVDASEGTSSVTSSLSELSEALTSLKTKYDLLSTAQSEMDSGDGLSASTIKSLADATEDYIDYLYEENGIIKLNTEAWREYANKEMSDNVSSIESEIESLQKRRVEIESQIEALGNAKTVADDFIGPLQDGTYRESELANAIAAVNARLDENTAAITENQGKLGIYSTLYDNITASLDAYSAALTNFENVKNLIDSVSSSLTTVADLQEIVANGFTLSLDKALEFASVYPEILNSASMAADGQITLNEDVVNAFIEGKEFELKSQIDAKISELESDKTVLEAKKAFCEAQLGLAKSVGEGEGNISKEVAQYRLDTANQLAAALIDAGIDEATAFRLAAASMSDNSNEFNQIVAEVCTDINGNFNEAASGAAETIYYNMHHAKEDVASLASQAHETARAIKDMANGIISGSSSVKGGSGGGVSGSEISITLSGAKFKGTDYTYEAKTISLEDYISDLELDISKYNDAISQIDGQIAVLESLRNTSLNKFSSSSKKASSGSSKTSSSSPKSSSTASNEETWFEKQYKLHNHLLDMNAESVETYLNWLNSAYQQAYKEGILSLDDFYKYQQEVYKGLQDLFKDYLNDVEHEISMRKNFDGESKKIISLYQQLIQDVEKEIKAARAQGLDDTDDYVQALQDKWASYRDSIKEIEADITDNAKDALSKLIDYQQDMLKQDIESQKDAIDEKLDYLKDFYNKQKEMLQDQYDEEKYLKDQSEKRKSVSDIQSQIAQLEYDDSAWAQKRKAELQKELSDAQGELDDFEKQHALDLALDALENSYDEQEAQLQKQMDALDEELNDPEKMFNKALAAIQENTGNLYQQMIEFNRKYGTGNDEDVKDTYEEAYKALLEYKKLHGKDYEGVVLTNSTGYKPENGSWDNATVSGTNSSNQNTSKPTTQNSSKNNAPSLAKGSTITVKKSATNFSSSSGNLRMASYVPGGTYTVYESSGNEVLIGRNGVYTGWIKKSDIVGYATGTRKATAGIHSIDELGSETTFESKDGTRYKLFTGGEKVLSARASNFLYEFASSGGEIFSKVIQKALGGGLFEHIRPAVHNNEIKMGDIIVKGNCDNQTVSQIRREQRSAVEMILREFNKLNK